jgi:hypothetical protein
MIFIMAISVLIGSWTMEAQQRSQLVPRPATQGQDPQYLSQEGFQMTHCGSSMCLLSSGSLSVPCGVSTIPSVPCGLFPLPDAGLALCCRRVLEAHLQATRVPPLTWPSRSLQLMKRMWHDSGMRAALCGKRGPERVAPKLPVICYPVASILEAAC